MREKVTSEFEELKEGIGENETLSKKIIIVQPEKLYLWQEGAVLSKSITEFFDKINEFVIEHYNSICEMNFHDRRFESLKVVLNRQYYLKKDFLDYLLNKDECDDKTFNIMITLFTVSVKGDYNDMLKILVANVKMVLNLVVAKLYDKV